MYRTSHLNWLVVALLFVFVQDAASQILRTQRAIYLRPQFGFVNYIGDNNIDMTAIGFMGQLEVGYQITHQLALAAAYNYGDYTENLRPDASRNLPRTGSNSQLSHAQALVRFLFGQATSSLSPYIHVGLGVAFGGDHPDDTAGWGAIGGVGLDVWLNRNMSFFVEASTQFTYPDDAVDGPDRGLFADHDLLNRFGIGIQFTFKKPDFIPVEIYNLRAPSSLMVDQVGTFVADANISDASDPVEFSWDFGDGTTSPLREASHSFSEPGTYSVTFDARNDGSSDSQSRTVIVLERPQPAEITSMSNFPTVIDTNTPVAFEASVVGNPPLTYFWRFSDGSTSSETNPTHTFRAPGNYTVTLTVTNDAGSDTQNMQIMVDRVEALYCKEVTELNTVYFGQHSSFITDATRSTLQDNLEILRECPNMFVRVEGYAIPGEQDAEALAADRARAVEEFYVDNGVTPSRVFSQGRGVVSGIGSRKDGMDLYRRAETVIVDN